MSFLITSGAHIRTRGLYLRLLNSLRNSPGFELSSRTPCSPTSPWLHCSATITAAQASPAVSGSEESLPVCADSATVTPVNRKSTDEGIDIVPKTLEPRKWNKWSQRTGLVAIKLGMTQLWGKQGFPIAVTVLQVCACVCACVHGRVRV